MRPEPLVDLGLPQNTTGLKGTQCFPPPKPPKGGEVWLWLLAAHSEGAVLLEVARPKVVTGFSWFRVAAQSCPEFFWGLSGLMPSVKHLKVWAG